MIYRTLRWVSGILLHWFYSDIRTQNDERIPRTGPILVAVNHPNAMVDCLVAGWVIRRRLRLTAKATLLENPLTAFVFRLIGVVPLRRAQDRTGSAREDVESNKNAFSEIISALRRGEAVLIFPEGASNSDALLPLKSGLARVALQARADGVHGVTIVPVGLSFENKSEPGTRVIASVGRTIDVDSWAGDSSRELIAAVTERLTEVSHRADFPERVPATPPNQNAFVSAASWWGRTTHELPVRYARRLAVAKSENADEPAMLTMLYGIGFVLASYAIHASLIGFLTRSLLLTVLYLATLITGAYWTAFAGHRR